MKRYAYAWITLGFFSVSLALHGWLAWLDFSHEATDHGQTAELSPFFIQWGREIFENWQSEFLQLLWQVVGLAYFLYVGSPSSKENDDRLEAKIDELLKQVAGPTAPDIIERIDEHYLRHHGHAKPHKALET
jgi:hypothetical protein